MLRFDGQRVYLACGKTDMRKSINGLVAIVEGSFNLDPFEGALFVFCNGHRDRIKILEWDGDGFWLYLKRLEKGHFRWPSSLEGAAAKGNNRTAAENATIALTGDELATLLSGTRIELKLKRNEVFERKFC